MMAALWSSVLRDHLCWLWRMGNDSGDAVLAEAALFAEQVLRVLGVDHASLDDMLCQVSSLSTSANSQHMPSLNHLYLLLPLASPCLDRATDSCRSSSSMTSKMLLLAVNLMFLDPAKLLIWLMHGMLHEERAKHLFKTVA